MTPQQIALVQNSFAKVVPIAPQAAALSFGKVFYDYLFALDPTLKTLFKGDMTAQGEKLMQIIATAVNSLDDLDALVPVLQKLGRRHVEYGVKNSHYDTVGAALIQTLAQGLGDAYTSEINDAWIIAYALLSKTMLDAAAGAR